MEKANQRKVAGRNYKELTDDELVILARENDELAIKELLSRYNFIIKAKARKYYAPGLDNDDLIQEGNIGLLNAVRDYKIEHPTSFKIFCELCIQRQIITAIKTATRQKHMPLNQYLSFDKPMYEEESDRTMHDIIENTKTFGPEELVIGQESIWEILTKLKDRLSPFEAKVLEGQLLKLSYQEIADSLNKHVKSVDNAMQRIRNKLQKITEEMEQNRG